ncbi:outer membrane protein assembly factor BamD [Desulfothermus naphthae]
MMNYLRIRFLISVIFIFLLFSGCGIIDYYFLKPKPQTPLELLEAGEEALSEKNYDRAIEYFEKMKDKYPFSPYTVRAELLLGDSYFYAKKYEEAETAYKEFESLHPGHKNIDYVIFQIGMSNFYQKPSIDLPQLCIHEAISYFTRLIEAYPKSQYVQKAKEMVKKCRYILAKHEIYVANFYFRTKRYKGAWKRYLYIQQNFPEFKDILEYSKYMAKIAHIKYELKLSEEKREKKYGGFWTKIKRWL